MTRVQTNIFDETKHFDETGFAFSGPEPFYDDKNEYYRYKYILGALMDDDFKLCCDEETLEIGISFCSGEDEECTFKAAGEDAGHFADDDFFSAADLDDTFHVRFYNGYAKVWDGKESYFLTMDEYIRIVNLAKKYMNSKKSLLVLLGGCFNPVTKAHLLMAKEMAARLEDAFVVFVPTCDYYIRSYKKYGDEDILPEEARYEMLTECCLLDKNILVDDCEILEKRNVTRTFRTLHNLKKRYGTENVYFSVGSGDLKYMSLWWNIDKMIEEYGCVVVDRKVKDVEGEIDAFDAFRKNKDKFLYVSYDNIYENLSSTMVRQAMKRGEDVSELIPQRAYECLACKEYGGKLMEMYREACNGQKK